jgi:hypothetical protein
MRVEIAFRDTEARGLLYYLRLRYNSKRGKLGDLIKLAARTEAAAAAKLELEAAEKKADEEGE